MSVMERIRISDFLLFQKEGSDHFTGYANYFGLERRSCIIRKTEKKFVVLVQDEISWVQIGILYPQKPEKVKGAKDYEDVGLIWTPEHTFLLLKDGNRFIGL